MNIFKKIRRFLRYHTGSKEFISNDRMNDYIPDVVFERDVMLYIIKYKPELNVYTMIVQQYNQGLDI